MLALLEHPVADPVAFLAGGWTVERRIEDRTTGTVGTFRGTATFRPPTAAEAAVLASPAGAEDDPAPGTATDGDPESGGAGCPGDRVVLAWQEAGTLVLGDHRGPAGRLLLVVRDADGEHDVRFDDGRPFHPLDLSGGRSRVDHPCRDDHYAGELRAEGPDVLVVAWRVHGPRKDQDVRSRYVRAA